MIVPKTYAVLARAVEEGIESGYRRAHKHGSPSSEATLMQDIHEGVMLAITEVFDFPETQE